MNEKRLYRRIIRRETHQSRSTASAIVLVLVALGAIYGGTETVLALLGDTPLVVSPSDVVSAYNSAAGWLPFAGMGAAAFGLVLIVIGIAPSRRARHGSEHERMAVVVDDRVLAQALADHTRRAAGIGPNRVRSSLGRRRGLVTLTPTSGIPLDRSRAQDAADELLESLALTPRVKSRITVSTNGAVGS